MIELGEGNVNNNLPLKIYFIGFWIFKFIYLFFFWNLEEKYIKDYEVQYAI